MKTIRPWRGHDFGKLSSSYYLWWRTLEAILPARRQVMALFLAESKDIIFTSVGAACRGQVDEPCYVFTAMELPRHIALGPIRLYLARPTIVDG